jgi:hypothetical protein
MILHYIAFPESHVVFVLLIYHFGYIIIISLFLNIIIVSSSWTFRLQCRCLYSN